jgi:preprotein translocase subunit YajC
MNATYIPLFYVAIFAVIYFFFIRPQQQKIKKEKSFVEELQKGTKVVTTGGIHGTIYSVDKDTFMLEIAKDTKICIEKSAISADLTQALNKDKKES